MSATKQSRHRAKPAPEPRESAFEKAFREMRHQPANAYPNVPARWLLKAALITLGTIALFGWLCLCLLYWQGSWQLLYHPAAAVTRTPASVGLAYEPVRFAPDPAGAPQLTGWWLPAENARYTVLYLHGADGNLGNTVDALAALHRAGLAVFAFDYRGYGQSRLARPSEAHWLEDAGHAMEYLTGTRHIETGRIVLYGEGLGADLAVEDAISHASVAGVILERPPAEATAPIFGDPRSRLVPALWLMRDRWDLKAAGSLLRVPSLWLLEQPKAGQAANSPAAYGAVEIQKTLVWLNRPILSDSHYSEELKRWTGDLSARP